MELLVLLSVSAVISTVVYYLIMIPLRNLRKLKGIPSPKTLPILGNAIEMWEAQHEFNKVLNRWAFQNGRRLILWGTFWFPMVVLGDAKDARKVLSSREHVQKGLFYKAFDLAIGTGAFNSPVGIWKERRPHLEQAFHSKVLSRCPQVFDKAAKSLIRLLKAEVNDGRVFDVHPYINLCAMQMLIEGGFGVKVDIVDDADNPIWQKLIYYYNRGTYLAEYRMLRPWFLLSDFLWNYFGTHAKEMYKVCKWPRDNAFKMILNKGRENLNNNKKPVDLETEHLDTECMDNEKKPEKSYPMFLDLVLEMQKTKPELKLTDEEIIDEIASLYIAGHDATGKSISFTLLYLGFYPELQEKVVQEIDEIFPRDKPDRPITDEDLGKMKYLECCIKESLRLAPPVSFITRKVGADVQLDEDAVIPKGTEVAIATYLIHRDENIYPNPEAYQPDRFLPENTRGRDPYAWIPFSAGPRNCLGPKFAMMEEKIVLANFFKHFKVESIGSKDNWVLNTNVTLKLEGGWNIKLHPRT